MDHPDALYAALLARDARFDGRFFVGVTSTGIYCRPVCRVRAPKRANCRFFDHPAAAEQSGFRPCRRCRPELAPPVAASVTGAGLAGVAAARIDSGLLDEAGLPGLAARLGLSDRHLRRVFRERYGVSPVAYAQTQRLLLAKRLLTDTVLPVTEVALAAGFGSPRRFNALFLAQYGMAPSALRREAAVPAPRDSRPAAAAPEAGLRFELAFRPPLAWPRLIAFLGARVIPGVERVDQGCYRRSVRVAGATGELLGWLELAVCEARQTVLARLPRELVPVLPQVLAGVRRLCDLACEPTAVAQALGPLAEEAPGLRIPGAFDGFEMSVCAILGQQITVRAANTLAGRLVARFGAGVATPFAGLDRVFPTSEQIAALKPQNLVELGIVRQRAEAILALARAVTLGALDLGPGAEVEAQIEALLALPGIGPWTAQYIALRALGWPDAWPSGDLALRKAMGGLSASAADQAADSWRPWRGYAALHLWRSLAEGVTD